jgi:hypothetical protein
VGTDQLEILLIKAAMPNLLKGLASAIEITAGHVILAIQLEQACNRHKARGRIR